MNNDMSEFEKAYVALKARGFSDEHLLNFHASTASLGQFITSWVQLEATIEYAIGRVLDLDPVRGSIITCDLQFRSLHNTLDALLRLDAKKYGAAIKITKRIGDFGERNNFLHNPPISNPDGYGYLKRKVNRGFRSKKSFYSVEHMAELSREVTQMIIDLENSLGIEEGELNAYFQAAHSSGYNLQQDPD